MDDIAAPYVFIEKLRHELEAGASLLPVLRRYVRENTNDLSEQLELWLLHVQTQSLPVGEVQKSWPLYRKSIFDLLDLSRSGVSIIEPLKSMEQELLKVCENDLQRHLDRLPFKLMVPMLFLQFPAVMLLIVGPLMIQFFAEVGS